MNGKIILVHIVFDDEKIRDDLKFVANGWLLDRPRAAKWTYSPKSSKLYMNYIKIIYIIWYNSNFDSEFAKVRTDLRKTDNRFCIVRSKNLQYFIRSAFFIKLFRIIFWVRSKSPWCCEMLAEKIFKFNPW